MFGDRDPPAVPSDALTLVVANELSALAPAAEAVRRYLEGWSISAKALYAVELVIEESLMNVILHAFEGEGPHSIDLAVWVEPEHVVVQVRDDGKEFDPAAREPRRPASSLADAAPGGLGLHLMQRLGQRVSHRREGGRNCLTVTVARNR